jgi:ribonuclease E
MDQLEVPGGMSLIARTAAIGRQAEELQWDLNYLMQLWTAIEGAAKQQSGAFLIYLEGSLVIRAIRDYFQPEIGEILIDTDEVYEQARAFMDTVMPGNVHRVKRYHDDVPLFSRFQIEHQIETAFGRQVNLPSGGAIVIDHTEALVAVDVNSGRSTKGADIEETAFKTNLEAAEELARQLRLRDLGGLIVIDFIDMENQRNQREVENRLRDALRFDRARVQMGKISRFGLMELSRQRLRPALAESSSIPCPRCTGTGHIRSAESAALHILRILEEEAMKENTGAVHVQVPVDVATFLLNEKRPDIQAIELRHKATILLIPNIHLVTPAHTITRLRHDDMNSEDVREPSYKMVDIPAEEIVKQASQQEAAKPRQQAMIKGISPEQPAPIVAEKTVAAPVAAPTPTEGGLFSKIFSWFRSSPAPVEVTPTPEPARKPRDGKKDGRRDRNDNRRGRNNRNNEESGERSNERPERQERSNRNERNVEKTARDETAGSSTERQERRPRADRKDRQRQQVETVENKNPSDLAALPAIVVAAPATANPEQEANSEEQSSRRRGRRGGRGRGERRPDTENSTSATPPQDTTSSVSNDAATAINLEPVVVVIPAPETLSSPVIAAAASVAAIEKIPEPVIETTPVIVPEIAESVMVATPAVEPAIIESPVLTQETLSAVTPITVEVKTVEPVAEMAATPAPVIAEPVNLDKVLADSGLMMVQTSTQPDIAQAAVPVKLGRPRKPKVQVDSADQGPLVAIETTK